MHFTAGAKIAKTVLALLLLVPVIGIRLQDEKALESFHNRSLTKMPPAHDFWRDPAAYAKQARTWLADRVYPIAEASSSYKHFQLYVLQTPPQRRVTMGKDGFIFLNGATDQSLNGIFDMVCVRAHSEGMYSAFIRSLPDIRAYAQHIGVPVDVLVIPTSATLYGDYLPESVPPHFRDACLARTAGDSPLQQVNHIAQPTVVYPFKEMKTARDDPGFFPKGNWHADGLSLKVARDAYLARLNFSPPSGEHVEAGTGASEILQTYKIDRQLPIKRVVNPAVSPDPTRAEALRVAVLDLFDSPYVATHAYRNTSPPSPQRVLMLSDSYGNRAAAVFAGAFAEMLHVTTNDMKDAKIRELIRRVRATYPIDRVILLVQEGGVDRVIGWSQALAADAVSPLQQGAPSAQR